MVNDWCTVGLEPVATRLPSVVAWTSHTETPSNAISQKTFRAPVCRMTAKETRSPCLAN